MKLWESSIDPQKVRFPPQLPNLATAMPSLITDPELVET